MALIEVSSPLKGALNTNYLLGHTVGEPPTHLLRVPRKNDTIFKSLDYEYNFLGYTAMGGTYRRRTPQEQAKFAMKAASLGLKVLPPSDGNGVDYTYGFLNDIETLDIFLPKEEKREAEEFIIDLFRDLRTAHAKRIIYGDRWSKNILSSKKYGLIHVDFDLELTGPPAKEFEVAQVAYYSLSGGKEKVIPVLAKLLSNRPWFDFSKVARFLRGHAVHFNKTSYGGIINETETLIAMVEKIIGKGNK